MTRRPRTLRWYLTRAAVKVVTGTTVAVVLAVYAGSNTSAALPSEHFERATPMALAQSLALQHGCWSGAAPADMVGAVPGHVIVTRPDHTRPEYLGVDWVGPALERVFDHEHPGLTVHAFCR